MAGGNSNSPVAKLPATGDKADGAALLGLACLAAGIYLRGKKQVQ
ncbi:LPXTG cell wall anchor domain-containing protein [Listeria grayi]